jgi:hypothetical protein
MSSPLDRATRDSASSSSSQVIIIVIMIMIMIVIMTVIIMIMIKMIMMALDQALLQVCDEFTPGPGYEETDSKLCRFISMFIFWSHSNVLLYYCETVHFLVNVNKSHTRSISVSLRFYAQSLQQTGRGSF